MSTVYAKKLSVTIRTDLLERMDSYASANGLTRSSLISIAVSQYLSAIEAQPSINKLLNAMASVADGVISGNMKEDEAKARIEAIQATYESLNSKQ